MFSAVLRSLSIPGVCLGLFLIAGEATAMPLALASTTGPDSSFSIGLNFENAAESTDDIQSIIIDRVRIDDDGNHWIVDYKTSSHEGGELDGFLRQEQDRYRPQLEKYAAMYSKLTDARVRKALYFPLLQRFVEVD